MRRLNFEDIKQWVDDNTNVKLLSKEYKNAKTKLKFRCECNKEFDITWDSFKNSKNHVCKSCSNSIKYKGNITLITKGKFKTTEEEVRNIIENNMECRYIGRYIKNRKQIVVFECPIHGRQEVFWCNIKRRKKCPLCNEYNKQNSILSQKVENYLIENNIEYIKEYKFEECKDKRCLPFDFYLPNNNICIEVQGEQHYKKKYFGNYSNEIAEEKFNKQQLHDKIKRSFCKENYIKLIEIPYWTDNKQNEYLDYLDKLIKGEGVA